MGEKENKFKELSKRLSLDALISTIEKESINYADILAERINQEKNFEKWLFQHKTVDTYQSTYVRNEEGHMKHKRIPTSKIRPTSNGHEQVCYLIDMAKKYESDDLARIINKAIPLIIKKAVNEGAYFKVVGKEARKTVMELDFNDVACKYLELPNEMQNKDALLSFFENEEITNSLFDSGYSIAKTLMTEYEDELLDDEITKLVTYIYSRLERMEEQIINIEKPAFTKKVDQMIKGYKEGKETTLESVEQTIKKLQDCNSDVRHNLKAKYNRELSRYFKLLKPYYKKHELDADDVNHELAELYVDLAKTYEIINDETYVNASRKHDAQIVELNGILKQLKPSTKKTEKKKKFSVIDIWDNDRLSSIPRGGVADRDGGMM